MSGAGDAESSRKSSLKLALLDAMPGDSLPKLPLLLAARAPIGDSTFASASAPLLLVPCGVTVAASAVAAGVGAATAEFGP